ncbi:unnamed protein product [Microthlaspi erraticum]|uniref:Retrotransposon gag domain-containing protein n=1 Tax=Microthlaspi erraticum TaxID=1685480 RepID=A0A6D2ILH5_9BRAS|nr:unnamed protein product [Microthlaspi erraticum]
MNHRGEIPPMDGDRFQGKGFPPRPPKPGQQEKRGRQSRSKKDTGKPDAPSEKRNRDDHDDLPPPSKRQVSMIMGCLLDGDDSISAIKEYEQKAVTVERYPYIHKGNPTIFFTDKDAGGLDTPHLDPLVVTLQINDCDVAKILADIGSTVNLIFKETLDRMGLEESSIKSTSRLLTGFTAEHVYSCGTVRLPVFVSGISKLMKFIVMDKPAIYNAILGTPWLHEMKAVISTFHQCVKFPTPYGIFTLRGNQRVMRSCFLHRRKLRTASSFMVIEPSNQPPREEPEPTSDNEINRSNTMRRATIAREEILPIPPRRAGAVPTWKSDLRFSVSTKKPKKLLDLFEMEQLEDEPLRSYLNRFKSTLVKPQPGLLGQSIKLSHKNLLKTFPLSHRSRALNLTHLHTLKRGKRRGE